MPHATEYDVEWWEHAAERSPIAVAFVDDAGRYGYVNPAFSKLLGWSRAETIGKHWADITPLTEVGEGQLTEIAGRAGKLIDCYETKHLITKAGDRLLVSLYAHRMPTHGDYKGWVMFATDATGTREAVQSLKDEYMRLQGRVQHMQDESVKCQASCLAEIKRAQEAAQDTKEQLDELTHALLARNGNGSRVSIGGDYSGRDKTNTPTVVLVWIVVAAMALGLAAMGAKLIAGMHDGKPSVTVEP